MLTNTGAQPVEKAQWLKKAGLELGNKALVEEAFLACSPSRVKTLGK